MQTLFSHLMLNTVSAPVLCRILNVTSPSIMEKPMEVYRLDERYVITPYVAGVLHPAIF